MAAIAAFEQAEINRDNPDTDKIDNVLTNYWVASLKARILLMSFK